MISNPLLALNYELYIKKLNNTMKKTCIYITGMAIMASTMLAGCDISSSRNYLGTMAGAEIGGVVGEALGWMSTSRHDGPGKAMLGSVIGTVAGAAIGNSITKDHKEQPEVRVGRSNRDYNGVSTYGRSDVDYQTGGGYSDYNDRNYGNDRNYNGGIPADRLRAGGRTYSPLTIAGLTYQDEDGDGRISRNETINIIYEVTNTSSQRCDGVELRVDAVGNEKAFALSPATTISMAPHETIRYKAKAFCKSRTSSSTVTFTVSAGNQTLGFTTDQMSVRMLK